MRRRTKLAWIFVGPVLALLFVEATRSWLEPMVGSPFLAVIFLTSVFLGFRAAVASTLVSAALLDFFVLPPVLSFYTPRESLMRLAMFVGLAIVTAGLASLSRQVD